ncbi:MAG: hypothetical protein ABFD79_13345, partial [Phycisphaerales bacterium]
RAPIEKQKANGQTVIKKASTTYKRKAGDTVKPDKKMISPLPVKSRQKKPSATAAAICEAAASPRRLEKMSLKSPMVLKERQPGIKAAELIWRMAHGTRDLELGTWN